MRQLRCALAPLWLTGIAVALVAIVVGSAGAQTQFNPYFGKSRVKYDNFEWHIYTTDHFEIYFYPETEPHLERLSGYAESAYQQISADLKHDLAIKIPLVLYKTHSEFEQTNIYPVDIPEGVAAFAEPQRDRMVLPIDLPPDRLYGLIVHELTHIFEFDIIPRSLIRQNVPLWIDEGLADYMRGAWTPQDLMTIRDAAVADIIPEMSKLEGYGGFRQPRLIYNLGHAVFEFIESRWGKEGMRQFLFSLRKNVIEGGTGDAYEEAFRISPDEFDAEFDSYLKDRFKPFRDKERPADYGRNLAPDPEETRYPAVWSIEPSPSGDLIATMAINTKDRELDIVLISAKDGEVIRNLTTGFNKDYGWEYIATPGEHFNTVPWMSWSPVGDRIAYFVRTEKQKSLVLQNVLSRRVEQRIEMQEVDEPESPDMSPDGTKVVFSALQGAVGDIFMVDLATDDIVNLTNDDFADYAPTFAPDGESIVYLARVSGNNKLFELDLATGEKTQLTFGTHDDAPAQFLGAETIVFSSTAVDPTQPIPPEVASNGQVYNIWTLSLTTGELQQYTDALGGNISTVVLSTEPEQIGFLSYSKGEYGLYAMTREDALYTANTSDFGTPGPIIDFQVPLTHTLISSNSRRKGTFEKMFLEGRPPVNVGVTSGGDVVGGSQVVFTDVLGDQQFNVTASSIAQYRTLGFSYINLASRFQYALQGYSQTQFFFGLQPGTLFDPSFAFLSRDRAIATRTVQGGTAFGILPFSRYSRLEMFGGVVYYNEEYNDPGLQTVANDFQQERFGTEVFRTGTFVPLGAAFVQETTVFREFGPLAGRTMRVSFEIAPKIGNTLSRQTFEIDARRYLRIGSSGLLALRFKGFRSWGDAPDFLFFGGNSEMRGYEYLEFLGHEAFFANAELRFPLVEAMLTPIGVMGGFRGVLFFNIGGASFVNSPFTLYDRDPEVFVPTVGFQVNPVTEQVQAIEGDPLLITGFRLRDSRASYGFGLTTFAIGFPIHLDWTWRTLFNRRWEDALFAANGGSEGFRRSRFDIWIGYDF